ncbi:hypothetical protein LCGC14_0372990 [marine sediment metagenome]|uniref:Recombination endonuclease VII n=1 Tax=marine sediment metagenome TaxID=412755 RepID=A0A0F9TA73_9ZZZZ
MNKKEAKRLYDIEYRKKNRDKINKSVAAYRAQDPARWKRYKKDWTLKHKYGISFSDFEDMLAAQDWFCAICEASLDLWGSTTHVDHDHETGEVRGILCVRCNIGIGYLRDADVLEMAKKYLCKEI